MWRNKFFASCEYHMFYILYPFVTNLLTLSLIILLFQLLELGSAIAYHGPEVLNLILPSASVSSHMSVLPIYIGSFTRMRPQMNYNSRKIPLESQEQN
jgi:hypothetical protein